MSNECYHFWFEVKASLYTYANDTLITALLIKTIPKWSTYGQTDGKLKWIYPNSL